LFFFSVDSATLSICLYMGSEVAVYSVNTW